MTALALRFPILRQRPGVDPWNPAFLDEWAASGGPGSAERWALRFLLKLWNSEVDWLSGEFDVLQALAAWDHDHRQAFLVWAAEPWWP